MRAIWTVAWLLGPIGAAMAQTSAPADPLPTWGDTYRRRFEETQKERTASSASGCATSNCHRGNEPRPGETFLGREYDLWWNEGKGPHFRALKALSEDDRSDRMVKLLYGVQAVATDEPRCRACHTLDLPPELRAGQRFEEKDGVSCENCHGRSQDWGSALHFSKPWRAQLTADDRTKKGFYDTRDLVRRAEKCLECHLGTESEQVTHEMLAAGHPPLTFELSYDLDNVPKHWKDVNSYLSPEEGPWFAARTWAVGQAVLLRESMYRLVNSFTDANAPDFAVFECYACHHDLRESKQPTWRQRPTVDKSQLGQPLWETSAFDMCRSLVEVFAPEARPKFEHNAEILNRQLRIAGGDRAAARTAATEVAALADQLANKLNTARFDRASSLRVLRAIVRDREVLAARGYRTAVQVYYACHALNAEALSVSGDKSAAKQPIQETLAKMEELLRDKNNHERPEAYDGVQFGELVKQLETQLPSN